MNDRESVIVLGPTPRDTGPLQSVCNDLRLDFVIRETIDSVFELIATTHVFAVVIPVESDEASKAITFAEHATRSLQPEDADLILRVLSASVRDAGYRPLVFSSQQRGENKWSV